MLPSVSVVLTRDADNEFGSALTKRLDDLGDWSYVRSSTVVESWDTLADVCRGADTVYLLSALELPRSPSKSRLRDFRAGVSRVLECCQECGVSSLVFMSSARVVSPQWTKQPQQHQQQDELKGQQGIELCDESAPYISRQKNEAAYSIAMAEAEVLKASETQNLGKGVLYTCALRPGILYGTRNDESLLRFLSWVGWGLNRVTLLGLQGIKSDMVYFENLVDATVLAGTKLAEDGASSQAGGALGWSTRAAGPVCSGQAYYVTDGQPCSLQTFMDGVLQGLDYTTSKVLVLPMMLALAVAWIAELLCKMKITKTPPAIARSEVHELAEERCVSIARAETDLGYKPRTDSNTALRIIVDDLERDGWGRHTFLVPGTVYWIFIPLGMWLSFIAGYNIFYPAFLSPVQQFVFRLCLLCFRRLWLVRLIFPLAAFVHLVEGWKAFTSARNAGHRDTAPLWFIQTTILGYPSLRLIWRLLS